MTRITILHHGAPLNFTQICARGEIEAADIPELAALVATEKAQQRCVVDSKIRTALEAGEQA